MQKKCLKFFHNLVLFLQLKINLQILGIVMENIKKGDFTGLAKNYSMNSPNIAFSTDIL